jgi:tetratricopeptide (TPR) repeat protein
MLLQKSGWYIMGDVKLKNFVKQLSDKLTEIVGYSTALLVYVLSIFGRPPSQFSAYAHSISSITLIFSVLFLWIWRLPQIYRKKPEPSGIFISAPQKTKKKFLAPLFNNNQYKLSRFQRRLEFGLLLVLSLFMLGIIVPKIDPIIEELIGIHCITPNTNFPKIIVAPFTSAKESFFSENLANALDNALGDKFQVCRIRQHIKFSDEAITIGEQNQAYIIFWGNRMDDKVKVHFTPINWNTLDNFEAEISVTKGEYTTVLLAKSVLAEVQYAQGEIVAAQKNLFDALDIAKTQDVAENDPLLLSTVYYTFGLLNDPYYINDYNLAQPAQAIWAYSNAINYNKDQEKYYINRAALYWDSENYEAAIADYSYLIATHPDHFLNFHLLRGNLRVNIGQYSDGIADLYQALKHPYLDDYLEISIVYLIGKARLLLGEYNEAENIFRNEMPSIPLEIISELVFDLNELKTQPLPAQTVAAAESLIAILENKTTP